VQPLGVREPDDFDEAFASMVRDPPDAILMVSLPVPVGAPSTPGPQSLALFSRLRPRRLARSENRTARAHPPSRLCVRCACVDHELQAAERLRFDCRDVSSYVAYCYLADILVAHSDVRF
jgi:hypothetical protein